MEWELWPEQGFGVFNQSLTVYIDFSPLTSGAIRCVGPFSISALPSSEVQNAMRALTIELEDNFLESDQFVLWGGYSERVDYVEHRIKILDTICGFVPAVWMRTYLLGKDDPRIDLEWTQSVDSIVHRSGLSFPETDNSVVDSAMFHPTNAEPSVLKLYEIWEHLLGPNQNSLSMPAFRWTSTNEQHVAEQRLPTVSLA